MKLNLFASSTSSSGRFYFCSFIWLPDGSFVQYRGNQRDICLSLKKNHRNSPCALDPTGQSGYREGEIVYAISNPAAGFRAWERLLNPDRKLLCCGAPARIEIEKLKNTRPAALISWGDGKAPRTTSAAAAQCVDPALTAVRSILFSFWSTQPQRGKEKYLPKMREKNFGCHHLKIIWRIFQLYPARKRTRF